MLLAEKLIASTYKSALAEDAIWTPFGTALAIAVRVFRAQPEDVLGIDGLGQKNQTATILRLRVSETAAQGRQPTKGDRFAIQADGVTVQTLTVFGVPRHYDQKQLEWRLEAAQA